MLRNKKAFTILELLMAGMVAAIVTISGARLFSYSAEIFGIQQKYFNEYMECQAALEHIAKNVSGSAWVSVIDGNNITLHSHSYPNIREYRLKDGVLEFKDGDKPFIALAGLKKSLSGTAMPEGRSRPGTLWSDKLFEGLGQKKPGGRCFGVKIKLNKYMSFTDRFEKSKGLSVSSKAFSKESGEFIYVSSDERVTGVKDGTKLRPYTGLRDALSLTAEDASVIRYWGEAVIAENGDYNLSGEYEVAGKYLYFSPDTSVTVSAGSRFLMEKGASFVTEGEINFIPGQKTVFTSAAPLAQQWWIAYPGLTINSGFDWSALPSWMGIYIENAQDVINIQSISVENSINGINICLPNTRKVPSTANLDSINISNNILGLRLFGIGTVEIQRASFLNNYNAVRLEYYNSFNEANYPILNKIHDNYFEAGTALIIGSDLTNQPCPYEMRVNQNSFLSTLLKITSGAYGTFIFENNSCVNSNISGGSGKTFVLNNRSFLGDSLGNNCIPFVSLSHYSGEYIFANNICYGNGNNGTSHMEITNSPNVTIKNNIFYGSLYYALYVYDQEAGYSDINIENCTFSDRGTIYWRYTNATGVMQPRNSAIKAKNCIFWSDAGTVLSKCNVLKVTYSDIQNRENGTPFDPTFNPYDKNIHENPYLNDPANGDFTVTSDIVKEKGENGIEMGAYGGSGADGWLKGIGRTNE